LYLLLEVATILLVHENEVKVVLEGKLAVDVAVGGGELERRQEETDGD